MKNDIKKKLKSMVVPVIGLLVVGVFVLVIVLYQGEEEAPELIEVNAYAGETETITLENEVLRFEMDPTTTQFELTVKKSGKVWRSTPEGVADDAIALTAEKDKLDSTLLVTYSNISGIDAVYSSYGYSVKKGIYDIEANADYVKVNYSIGDVEKEYVIPTVIREADMEKLLESMNKSNAAMVQDYYKKYDINKLGKKDNKEELLAAYPALANEVLYILRDTTKDNMKTKFEQFFEEAGYTLEQHEADKMLDLSSKSSDKPIFNVSVVYRLDGGDLVVEVPLSEIQYRDDYPLYNLTLLPYFGAGGVGDEGFLFVPEGGGALIRFNNGKISQNNYYSNIYGWDMALNRDYVVHETEAYFATYGIASGEDSFLCLMEEGAPYASVQADISGKNNSYNFVNAVYSIAQREQYNVSDKVNGKIFVYLPKLPDETLRQRYRFINSNSYVDMAKAYQGYLKEQYGDYLTINTDTQAPVAVEIIGAVDKVKQVFGIPMSKPLKLTSYKDALNIVKQLREEGMTNLSIKLTGWMNGGVRQQMLSKVKPISDLGSKKDLKALASYAADNGIGFYLDGITNYAIDSNLFDGFVQFADSARFVTKEKAELNDYRVVTYIKDTDSSDAYYLLHADKILEMADNLKAFADKYNAGVSFQDIGDTVSSDFYRKAPVSRQEALNNQKDKLKELADGGMPVMINKGNDYAAAYSDIVTNMDLGGSEYTILDQSVPFYQIAVHGYINYTGEVLNLTQNYEQELLKSAEYGAGLSFAAMNESAFALQKTLYTEYFGADFSLWHDKMLEIYTRYNQEMGHIFNQQMTDHIYVGEKTSCTTYEDGTKVYVNYDYEEVKTTDGVTVPARDYAVVK
ncbi:MAG: hypothetical protein HFH74_02790 [Lachnospiraceae bacterium]|nr:hypothetical protein [Lachnospiraceae bacterium]